MVRACLLVVGSLIGIREVSSIYSINLFTFTSYVERSRLVVKKTALLMLYCKRKNEDKKKHVFSLYFRTFSALSSQNWQSENTVSFCPEFSLQWVEFIYLFIYLSIYLFIYLFIFFSLFIYLSLCLISRWHDCVEYFFYEV